jgi:hypothetical protein
MRHQLRLGARHLGKPILQQLCRPLVILLAGALQQRLVSGILYQRMLEQVARPRRAAALVEQLVDHQLTETALQRPSPPSARAPARESRPEIKGRGRPTRSSAGRSTG